MQVWKTGWLTGLFSLKIIAGLVYAWFYLRPAYYATSDTWRYFELSKAETDWLLKDPLAFLQDIFTNGYQQTGNLFLQNNSYWNDLKSNIIIKFLALCNVVTFKNYFADIVFFNFIFFFGPVALYRLTKQLFPVDKFLLITSIFLIPSFLFWCSGIHKDGFIFACIALILFYFYKQILNRKINFSACSSFNYLPGGSFCIAQFHGAIIITSFACLVAKQFISCKTSRITIAIYGAGIILFFVSAIPRPKQICLITSFKSRMSSNNFPAIQQYQRPRLKLICSVLPGFFLLQLISRFFVRI